MLGDLEDLFHGKVHFVVAGHQHAYGAAPHVINLRAPPGGGSLIAQTTPHVVHAPLSCTCLHCTCAGRTCPVYKYKCEAPATSTFIRKPTAPIYVVTGNAGAGFTHSFPPKLPDWVAFGAQDINGYVRFNADKYAITLEVSAGLVGRRGGPTARLEVSVGLAGRRGGPTAPACVVAA